MYYMCHNYSALAAQWRGIVWHSINSGEKGPRRVASREVLSGDRTSIHNSVAVVT